MSAVTEFHAKVESSRGAIAEGCRTSLLVVDVASMSKPDDNDQQDVVVDGVGDSVGAHPNSKTWPALQCPGTRGTRILRE